MRKLPSPAAWKSLLHPFLFAAAPIVFLYSNNIGELPPDEVLRTLLLLLAGVGFLQLSGRLFQWNAASYRAGLSIGIFLFFSYGQLYPTGRTIVNRMVPAMPYYPRLLAADLLTHELLMLALVPAAVLCILRIRRSAFLQRVSTDFLLGLGALLLLSPILGMLPVLFAPPLANPAQPDNPPDQNRAIGDLPDIYYFVLDGYARQDILADVYQFDNEPFLEELEQRGFFVARGAKSNYSMTVLSLTTTWNMEYLEELTPGLDVNGRNKNILLPFFRQNRVMEQLQNAGYRSYAFPSGYPRTEWTSSDEFLQQTGKDSGLMASLLIETTGIRFVESAFSVLHLPFPYPGYREHRERIDYVFDTLPGLIDRPGPKIVIAHLMAPHPAFVADADGKDIIPRSAYRLADASDFPGTVEEYISGYRAEVTWINRKMMESIDLILRDSATPPVIILQADHGPGALLDYSDPQPEGIRERMRILTAFYLPGAGSPEPYAEITPVNIFRLVFDRYLGTSFGLLPDHSYFSSTSYPFRMILEDKTNP